MNNPRDKYREVDIRSNEFPFDSVTRDQLVRKIDDLPDSDQMVDGQIELIKQVDGRKALERLVLADLVGTMIARTDSCDDGVGLFGGTHTYLVGLIMAYGDSSGRDCSYRELTENIADLPFIYMLSEFPAGDSDLSIGDKNYDIASSLASREFNEGRPSLPRQAFEASIRMYSPHNKYLNRELGFTIEQAVRSIGYIEDILTTCRRGMLQYEYPDLRRILTDRTTTEDYFKQIEDDSDIIFVSDSDKYARESRFVEEYYHKISEKHDLLSLNERALFSHIPENLSKSILVNFLKRLSADIDNIDEVTHSGDAFRYPYQINPLHKFPLPQCDNRIFLPDSVAVRRALRDILL